MDGNSLIYRAVLYAFVWVMFGIGTVAALAQVGCANPVPCPRTLDVNGGYSRGTIKPRGGEEYGVSDGSVYKDYGVGANVGMELGVDEHDCGFWHEQVEETE